MGGMVDNGAIDPMKECPTMARGLLMLSPLPNLMLSLLPRLMLIPSMIMDTTLDTMACLPMDTVDNGATTLDTMACLTMVMVNNGATMDTTLDPMAGLPMDTVDNGVTTLDTVVTHTIAMVETMDMATEDNGGKITHYYRSLLGHRQPQEKTRLMDFNNFEFFPYTRLVIL